jgi:hypothetical protein
MKSHTHTLKTAGTEGASSKTNFSKVKRLYTRQFGLHGGAIHYYYYYLFTAIGFAHGGSGPYTTQLQQKTYINNNKKHTIKTSTFHRTPYTHN